MKKVEIKPDIHWVGGIDWDLREFHGYLTQRGSTYNAYLIQDEKTVLIDTVKHYLFDEMVDRISELVDPGDIDIIVSNHVEMDHSGSLPKIKELCPNAKIITSTMGEKGLKRHYKADWDMQVVQSGDTLNIGKRTLHFVHTPMVHWPDNMVTYSPEDSILFSNDAFGQHIATSERFDDELCFDILREEAAKYYANIVLPYGDQVKKAMDGLGGLDMDTICPSHGIIWRAHMADILAEYGKWCTSTTEDRALIVYDTMWGSTEKMARSLQSGLEEAGVPTALRNLHSSHISDVMTDVLTSRIVCIGSPTLNNGMLPTVGAFLTYLKGLRPKDRVGFAFGSYGWGGQSPKEINAVLEDLKWQLPVDPKKLQYIPDNDELDGMKEIGRSLREYL